MAAVVAAPTAADAPATMAIVNFDMMLASDESLNRAARRTLLCYRCLAMLFLRWSHLTKVICLRFQKTRSQKAHHDAPANQIRDIRPGLDDFHRFPSFFPTLPGYVLDHHPIADLR
jgi:hypothetical protein